MIDLFYRLGIVRLLVILRWMLAGHHYVWGGGGWERNYCDKCGKEQP